MSSPTNASGPRAIDLEQQPTVLVVDDDALLLRVARMRLTRAGFRVVTAEGGVEGFRRAQELRPDAILSDVLMRELDGFALCRRIREHETLSEIPVILLSSHYDPVADTALARSLGAHALIARTPEFEAEVDALRSALGSPRPRVDVRREPHYEDHLRTTANQLARLITKARTSEGRYQSLFTNANDAMFVATKEGVILEVNERWLDLLQLPSSSVVGHHIAEFAAPGHEAKNASLYFEAVVRDRNESRGVALMRSDGAEIRVDFSTAVIDVAGEEVVLSLGRDVTEADRAHRAVAASEAHARALLSRIPDVIWTLRLRDGRPVYVSPSLTPVLGLSADEARTQDSLLRRVHPEDAARVGDAYRLLQAIGTAFDIDYRWRRGEEWIPLRARVIAVYRDGDEDLADLMMSESRR